MTKHTISSDYKLELGKVYTAFVVFGTNHTEGKRRPVIIFQNQENNKITAFQVSSKIDTPFNKKFGYKIKDWEETGLKKPSVANLHPKDLLELEASDLKVIVGELTDRDKVGLLEKYITVQKKIQRENEFER
ncbi:type II toxin-antitoxin system PemK/MazF family toxin [Heyndrickxia ginsengihumi]|uniref:type II toxin-antitoxin system PemK/MazF family toxin n=1 Tax=Heyndrickxia ginsengihumi TaxID=363870 RepID=UPI00046F9A82|nr:type II toxin-antitoxin system PemK/MazF family toxin [Heyndrickxia ginsengihumi]